MKNTLVYSDYNPFLRELYGFFTYIPDGYTLVESPEHKRERLQKEIEEKRASVAYLTKHLAELSQQIEAEEKDLLALKP